MEIEYIAHRREHGGEVQPLDRHLSAVGRLAAANASKLALPAVGGAASATLESVGELLGLLHDLGKYSKAFQDYLKSATGLIDQDADNYVDSEKLRGHIDHSTAGAHFLWNAFGHDAPSLMIAQMLALCVASHHSGLIDCIGPGAEDVFTRRMSKAEGRSHRAEAVTKLTPSMSERIARLIDDGAVTEPLGQLIRTISEREARHGRHTTLLSFKIGLLTRFLFSCLIDADRVDTADFEKPLVARQRRQDSRTDWEPLIDRLERHLGDLPVESSIDEIRREVSDHCLHAAEREQGIFSLTVPTGGGKTLASLRFALHHAKRHGLERVIYVIPFTSIIDQNADVVRGILEPEGSGITPGSIVLEHHSNLTPDEQTWRSKILSENWDAPVVFTTSVQLLETLFGPGTRGARRMHQLAKSVMIFDEAQTIPVRCVHMFNNAVNFLVEHCGSSVVLCTATQPLLGGVDPAKGAARFSDSDEIIPDPARLFASLRRTRIVPNRRPEGWSDEAIADLSYKEIEKTGSCLVIVNTRKAARSLYELARVGGDGKKYHLSTMMCPAHRRAIFAEIRSRLCRAQPSLCVSTQLIEAGIDIDFGAVIRLVAGLDSIAQAAGRCNRNGLRKDDHGESILGNVHVINPADDSGIDRLDDIREGCKVTRRLLDEYAAAPEAFDHDLLSPAAIMRYFEYYFYQRADVMAYPVGPEKAGRDDTLLNLLSENRASVEEYKRTHPSPPPIPLRQAFKTAARAFKAIDAPTQGVIVPYGKEGADLIARLCGSFKPEIQIDLLRRAQQFSVNVFPNVFESLRLSRAVFEIGEATGIFCLLPTHYSEQFGLSESQVSLMEANIA
jgi:CRISPR-associated endonuclease/helicase Cas3